VGKASGVGPERAFAPTLKDPDHLVDLPASAICAFSMR
jgi:hypothetical protein